jgi:hypothetical protein
MQSPVRVSSTTLLAKQSETPGRRRESRSSRHFRVPAWGTATGTRWIAQPQADGDLAETGASDRRPSGSGLEKLAVHESEFVEDEIDAEGPFVDAAAQQRLGSARRSAVGVMVASGRGHSLARPAAHPALLVSAGRPIAGRELTSPDPRWPPARNGGRPGCACGLRPPRTRPVPAFRPQLFDQAGHSWFQTSDPSLVRIVATTPPTSGSSHPRRLEASRSEHGRAPPSSREQSALPFALPLHDPHTRGQVLGCEPGRDGVTLPRSSQVAVDEQHAA